MDPGPTDTESEHADQSRHGEDGTAAENPQHQTNASDHLKPRHCAGGDGIERRLHELVVADIAGEAVEAGTEDFHSTAVHEPAA